MFWGAAAGYRLKAIADVNLFPIQQPRQISVDAVGHNGGVLLLNAHQQQQILRCAVFGVDIAPTQTLFKGQLQIRTGCMQKLLIVQRLFVFTYQRADHQITGTSVSLGKTL